MFSKFKVKVKKIYTLDKGIIIREIDGIHKESKKSKYLFKRAETYMK